MVESVSVSSYDLPGSNSNKWPATCSANSTFLWALQAESREPQIAPSGDISIVFIRACASSNSPARPNRSIIHP
ncbi:hypothetical protein V2J09_018737 [Rumex salicifolius]